MIIGLSGKKQSGKSTIANYLMNECGFVEISWAYPLKEIIGRELFGLSEKQLYGTEREKETVDPRWGFSSREILQIVGTDLFRKSFRQDFWVHLGVLRIKETMKNIKCSGIVVSDCRFPNECNAISDLKGINVRVERTDREDIDTHESETALDSYICDFTIQAATGELSKLYDQIDAILDINE